MKKTGAKNSLQKWWYQLRCFLLPKAQNHYELLCLLRQASDQQLMSSDTLSMLESILQFVDMQVRDVMIPRNQMVSLDSKQNYDKWLNIVIESGHSRFPVTGESNDDILGILHSKDLLKYHGDSPQTLLELLRPAFFVPASKHLNTLLKEFRTNRNHMAIVVDEYGGVAGFVTIEDILEQIVGDIEDEFDIDEDAFIKQHSSHEFIIKAHMPLDEFNQYFSTHFTDSSVDTLGGFVLNRFAYLPKRGDSLNIDGHRFIVLNADNRRIRLLKLYPPPSVIARLR